MLSVKLAKYLTELAVSLHKIQTHFTPSTIVSFSQNLNTFYTCHWWQVVYIGYMNKTKATFIVCNGGIFLRVTYRKHCP